MKKDEYEDHELTRRRFLKTGASAILAAGYIAKVGSAMPLPGRDPMPRAAANVYVCPPCGQPCDKLTFDKPGDCPNCGMTLVTAGGGAGAPPTVAILLFNGTELIDFAGPWEVFGTAGFLVHTVAEKAEPLTMVFGQKVIPDHTFETSPKADILLVPGGGVFDNIRNEKFMGWVKAKAKDVDHVMSVCTGAFILQAAGLLAGQTVTATYGMIEDLSAPDTKVVYDRRFVDNGKIITTAGLSSGIDGAFHLVSKISGLGAAQAAALSMEYPWEPEGGWARAALADRFLPDGMAYGKAKVQGLDAKLISTEGDTDKWEFKMLVSAPGTPDAVADVLRDRIASSTGAHGMFRPISHLKGAPKLSAKSGTTIKWTFTDDQGGRWAGTGTVEPDQNQKSIVTLRLART